MAYDVDFEEMDNVTYAEIGNWFQDLSDYYQEYAQEEADAGWAEDEVIPVTIGDIKAVYDHVGL